MPISQDQNNQIIIFDTTLRDGEQSPGFSMNTNDKIHMAQRLSHLGVDVMEAGFPIASPDDWNAVHEISKIIKGTVIAGLARSSEKDITAAASAIKPAERGRIHTFIATSDLHMKHKLKKSRDEVIDMIGESVSMARGYTDDVEWSAEDASRSDADFLCFAVDTAIKAGATTINLPDTVGYAEPDDYAEMFVSVMNRVPNADRVVFSAHCHNDRGMAVANSLAAVKIGVRQVEGTINGIGERAGNAAIEEVVMAMASRPDKYPFQNNVVTSEFMKASQCLEDITGIGVQPNKAIVGANAFAHEAGIHQDGMLKNRMTYEIMTPESVGADGSSLVIGKHSGRAAVASKLKSLGFYGVNKRDLGAVFNDIIRAADQNKSVPDDMIHTIAVQHLRAG